MSSREELAALARKYRKLLELRREHERTGAVAGRDVLRVIAKEFPGALRELDRLPVDEIVRRAQTLEEAAIGMGHEPWMDWLVAYHALMRAALFVKAQWAKAEDAILDERLASEATLHARIEVDADFVRAIRRPPGGRISHVVMDRLALRFGVAREVIEEAITTPSRSPRRVAHCR